jgi:hypothetical protein
VACLAFEPTGQVLASGGADHSIRLWDVTDLSEIASLEGHAGAVSRLAMSPDGALLASVSGDPLGTEFGIRLWDPREARAVSTLSGHTRYLTALAFSPDGRHLAAAGGEATISLWTSDLARLAAVPAGRAGLGDLEAALAARGQPGISGPERDAWEFIGRLLRRRRRHDVLLEDTGPRAVEVGAYDIEIEG